ncbi:MAG: hypothetical protein Q8L88_16545 [Bacteroidota bacterium]|nr:hypothetical protein [Bacteroidota bacterium]
MGLGQTMLSIMFLVLLTIAVVNGNRLIIDKEESYYKNQAYQEASILANNLLSEIVSKKFDHNVDTNAIGLPDSSVFSSTMKTETFWEWQNVTEGMSSNLLDYKTSRPFNSQNVSAFNDVDDYNTYVRNIDIKLNGRITQTLTKYTLQVRVYYVQRGNEDVYQTNKSYLKRIDVTVTDSKGYLTKPLNFSTIKTFGY